MPAQFRTITDEVIVRGAVMWKLVAQEFWRRHKLKVICFALWVMLVSVMYATGWIWDIEYWARERLEMGKMNPIVLLSLLIGGGMMIDANKRNGFKGR